MSNGARLQALVVTAALLLSAGTVEARNRDHELLQNDVDEIQRQLLELTRMVEQQGIALRNLVDLLGGTADTRRALADFNANVDTLGRDISELGNRFDGTEKRLRAIEDQLRQRARVSTASGIAIPGGVTNTDGTPSLVPATQTQPGGAAPGASTQVPSVPDADTLYNQAYGDYLSDNLDLAISEFREFIQVQPGHDLADNAQYWIAMSYFNSRRFAPAVREFDHLLQTYPSADNVTEAMYRKGISLAELNRLGQAVLVLNELVDRYPETAAAKQAEQRLIEFSQ